MVQKHPICLDRLRSVPSQFGWLDHRLVRDGLLDGLSHAACSLYLFLVVVADAQGLSFYSDASLCSRLSLSSALLSSARSELSRRSLAVYQRPLYQVLALDDAHRESAVVSQLPVAPAPSSPRMSSADRPVPVGDIIKHIMEILA